MNPFALAFSFLFIQLTGESQASPSTLLTFTFLQGDVRLIECQALPGPETKPQARFGAEMGIAGVKLEKIGKVLAPGWVSW
jgi:hypothetical protein